MISSIPPKESQFVLGKVIVVCHLFVVRGIYCIPHEPSDTANDSIRAQEIFEENDPSCFFFLVYRDAYHNFVLKLEHSNFISACICPGCNDAGTCQFVVMNTHDLLMSGERADVFLHSTSFSNFLLLFSFLLYARMDVGQCGNVSPILGRKTKMIDRLCAAYGFPVIKK